MSLRHLPRQPDRDVRMHDPPPPPVHPHTHNLVSHPPHPPHVNGATAIPTTPGAMSNGSAHVNAISPAAATTGPAANGSTSSSIVLKLKAANEQTWLLIGRVAEQMGDLEHALSAYENALRHNPSSLSGLTQVAGIARIKENYPKAIDYFQRVLQLQEDNGEVWSALGHCFLMQDDLQKAYSAYQQALYLLPNPKEDPKLWYGIGILYDRYGSLDHAEEAFSSVLRMDKDFDKANEILFRLGIIYKQQGKYEESLACFDRILRNPPSPLAHADIWFQIGHVYEQQKDHVRAKDAYERVVADNPTHAKVLQQLGWLYHQDGSSFQNQDVAIQYLTKSLEADPSDAQSWYLLGRAYMAGQKYNKAYEAYQQAVYRDGRNPTFWCSIGVLYFQINQFRDALDAYSRAIRINPYISEVWFDLGSLYESCNNQITDAIDAYARASELDPTNPAISQRLQLLKNAQATGGQLPAAPGPQDVHPTAYASTVVPPPGLTGPPLLLQSASHRPVFRTESRGPSSEIALPPPAQVSAGRSSPPFRGGPPPPVVLDETRHPPSHTPLAPMEVDRPPNHARDFPPGREGLGRGPVGHQSLLLQHPIPQQQTPPEELRGSAHPHHQDPYYSRNRAPSRSVSPPPHPSRNPRSPPPGGFQNYPPSSHQPVGPGQPSAVIQRSPRMYPPIHENSRPVDEAATWDRRGPPPGDSREWERERDRRSRHSGDYPHGAPPSFYPSRSPVPGGARAHSPPEPSPRTHPTRYWDPKLSSAAPSGHPGRASPPPPPHHEPTGRRYDPRYDARDREYEADRSDSRSYAASPEGLRRAPPPPPPPHLLSGNRESVSPHATPSLDMKSRRRMKEPELPQTLPQAQLPPQPSASMMDQPKRARKRVTGKRGSPDQGSSNGSSRSVQPSPTSAPPRPPSRVIDEDYDEPGSAADALMGLSSYRGQDTPNQGPSHSPTISSGSRHSDPSPRPPASHRNSVSSTRSHASPPLQPALLKRALSPAPEESESKRTRMEIMTGGPSQSTRPSPIPFRTQPTSHSPESRHPHDTYASSTTPPSLALSLPPHPRPVGAGHGQAHGNGNSGSTAMTLPPIATLSSSSTAPSPSDERDRDEKMQVDGNRSMSPPSRGKAPAEVTQRPSRSPPSKPTPSPPTEKKD